MNETMPEENEVLPELKYTLSVNDPYRGQMRLITNIRAYTVGVKGQVAYWLIGGFGHEVFVLKPGEYLEAKAMLRGSR